MRLTTKQVRLGYGEVHVGLVNVVQNTDAAVKNANRFRPELGSGTEHEDNTSIGPMERCNESNPFPTRHITHPLPSFLAACRMRVWAPGLMDLRAMVGAATDLIVSNALDSVRPRSCAGCWQGHDHTQHSDHARPTTRAHENKLQVDSAPPWALPCAQRPRRVGTSKLTAAPEVVVAVASDVSSPTFFRVQYGCDDFFVDVAPVTSPRADEPPLLCSSIQGNWIQIQRLTHKRPDTHGAALSLNSSATPPAPTTHASRASETTPVPVVVVAAIGNVQRQPNNLVTALGGQCPQLDTQLTQTILVDL